MQQLQTFSYSVKIYNPVRRSQFTWRDLHNITHKFESVATLRSALYHELEADIPDSGDFNVGYFEGRQQKKKWLASPDDLKAMYACFEGKPRISLWCDGKDPDNGSSSDEESGKSPPKRAKKKDSHVNSKLNEREDELESIFQQLKEKHGHNYSGPQLRLWSRMIVAKTQ